MSQDAVIAWLAGIIEGEGCISVGPKIVRITVNMTDRDVIERIDQLYPSPNGIREFADPRYKTKYIWRVGQGEVVREILTLTLPWLGVRRSERAREALAFLDGRPGGPQLKTHCAQEHEFTPENTYVDRDGYQNCRTCRARWSREARARRLARVPYGSLACLQLRE